MKFRTVLFFLVLSQPLLASTECQVDAGYLGAVYVVSTEGVPQSRREGQQVIIWRRQHQVAREYPDAGVTEAWTMAGDGRLYVSRYFDRYQRGIEYQPEELRSPDAGSDWERQSELIPRGRLESFELVSASGSGCDREEFYSRMDSRSSETLRWLPGLRLAREWRIEEKAGPTLVWALEEIVNGRQRVDAVFASREQYQMTDYSDIGDNESDPFLLKMINLGFVPHGASGFYDEHGQALGF